MSTTSKAIRCKETDSICQGDVFYNVKYSFIDSETEETVDIIEMQFPCAIVISQACDVIAMSDMVENRIGAAAKFMPSVLMCPIYDMETAKASGHIKEALQELDIQIDASNPNIFQKDDKKVADRDWHYRLHSLTIKFRNSDNPCMIENAVIDFKHYFSVPMSYLLKNRSNRVYRLDDLFAEQITLKFATYLSRVAIPD